MENPPPQSFKEWYSNFYDAPRSCGAKGVVFFVGALPIIVGSIFLGLSLLPPGRYMRIILVAPSIIISAIALPLYAYLVFKLPIVISSLLSIGLFCVGVYYSAPYVMNLARQLRAVL